MAKLILVDDHVLLRNGLAGLVENLGHTVMFQADNGADLLARLNADDLPDIILLDINMPGMDGYETSRQLRDLYPAIKVIALTMYDDETSIIRMLKNGVRGYMLKDIHPQVLKNALYEVEERGYYHSEFLSEKLMHALAMGEEGKTEIEIAELTEKEIRFLELSCTELTYKEIAEKMDVSPRTIDGYRDSLFLKLNLKSRVGLAIFAIRNNLVNVSRSQGV